MNRCLEYIQRIYSYTAIVRTVIVLTLVRPFRTVACYFYGDAVAAIEQYGREETDTLTGHKTVAVDQRGEHRLTSSVVHGNQGLAAVTVGFACDSSLATSELYTHRFTRLVGVKPH